MPSKILPLTSLRFFAAGGVLLYHLQGLIGVPAQAGFALGVSFFFVLSGFILTYTYANRVAFSFRDFMVARFARLWPVHFAAFLLVVALLGNGDQWDAVALNLTLLHSWLPIGRYMFSGNWVSWTISTEMAFYLLFPVLAFGRGRVIVLTVVAVFAMLAAIHLLLTAPQIYGASFGMSPSNFIMQTPFIRILEFASGVAAGKLFLTGHWREFVGRRATAFELGAIAACVLFGATAGTVSDYLNANGFAALSVWYNQNGGFVIFAVAIFVFAHSAGAFSKALSTGPLVLLGEISYCTYMVHQICFRFADMHHIQGAGWSLNVVAMLIVVYVTSYIMWRVVERPARSWIIWTARARRAILAT